MTAPTSTTDHDHHPKGSNFLLIVILFAASILVIFVVAYFILVGGGKHLVPGKHNPHPTSELVRPSEIRNLPIQNLTESPFTFEQQKDRTRV